MTVNHIFSWSGRSTIVVCVSSFPGKFNCCADGVGINHEPWMPILLLRFDTRVEVLFWSQLSGRFTQFNPVLVTAIAIKLPLVIGSRTMMATTTLLTSRGPIIISTVHSLIDHPFHITCARTCQLAHDTSLTSSRIRRYCTTTTFLRPQRRRNVDGSFLQYLLLAFFFSGMG